MSTDRTTLTRLRLILDCMLVVLVILVGSASYLSAQARSGAPTSAREVQVSGPPPLAHEGQADVQPAPALPALDNDTLAALIAAENSALTPPSYFTGLPLVTR